LSIDRKDGIIADMTHRFDGELPLLLIGSFRAIVDELHDDLREAGLGELRALHGFALKAIDDDGSSISEFARRMGVSKQAAAKTAASMEALGLAERHPDPRDSRASVITRTDRANAVMDESARFYRRLEKRLRGDLGDERYDALLEGLRETAGPDPATAITGWLGRATRA
jgi:DNA-binding MarR family transcriptional regulator